MGISVSKKIASAVVVSGMITYLLVANSCKPNKEIAPLQSTDISHVIAQMTDIMIHDITNPPLAARFFSYTTLAGYEIVSEHDSSKASMHGILNGYPDIQKPDTITGYSYQVAALLAMYETAKKMQPSGNMLQPFEQGFVDSCKREGITDEVMEKSMQYAQFISKQILAYAKADGYNKISNLPRYTPVEKEGSWYPTPPAFMAAVEPNFNTVRPFTLDSAAQFKPVPPVAYSNKKGAAFYDITEAVFNTAKNLTDSQKMVAAFWDCNPFAVQDEGHLQYGNKKISPGAHWLGITGIACLQSKKTFNETMQIYASVSVGLMDAFMCCWDEKYRSNRIRPETAIRKLIDPLWTPFLQTPPFPEYLSGHSTISSSSATILTHFFGDSFAYTDTVENTYGLPSRSFTSFKQAAAEAGISRFYGGIHFMDAIENGQFQGTKVGEWVLHKMRFE